jgi:hypothetical protein
VVKRQPKVFGDIVVIPLTKGYNAIVDLEDFDKIQDYNWCANVKLTKSGSVRTVYAIRAKRRECGTFTTEYLHSTLLPVEDIYGDYQPSWVEHLLHQAFEAGRGSGFTLGLREGYREGFEIGYNAKGREF